VYNAFSSQPIPTDMCTARVTSPLRVDSLALQHGEREVALRRASALDWLSASTAADAEAAQGDVVVRYHAQCVSLLLSTRLALAEQQAAGLMCGLGVAIPEQ